MGGWCAGHPCIVSKISGMLGNWETAHENCTIFRMSIRQAHRVTGWKNYANFEGSEVKGNGCLSGMSVQFLQLMEEGMHGNFCVIFWRSEAWGHYSIKLSS